MANFWDNCKIKSKLFIGIGAILAVFALSSLIVLLFVNGLAGSADSALTHITPTRAAALNMEYRVVDADDVAATYIMDRTAADWPADLKSYAADVAEIKEALPKLKTDAASENEREKLDAFGTWFDYYLVGNEHAFGLKRAGKYDAAIAESVAGDTTKGEALIADFVASTANRTRLATADVEASSRAAVVASIAGSLTAILGGAAIAFALGGSISKNLRVVTEAIEGVVREDFPLLIEAMRQFAAGDLSARVTSNRQPLPVRGKDETALLAQSYNNLGNGIKAFGNELSTTGNVLNGIIGDVKTAVDAAADSDYSTRLNAAAQRGIFRELGENLNRLMDVVSRTVVQIKDAAAVVSSSAREISAGNSDLSQRTEEQAASLEETAASMEELTATVNQNAENARQANVLAIGASTIAAKGGDVVGEVVETMAAINASGRKIVDIISVIDGIAFQTNILALNAAVEAARAGEQGRGFAVVAGEVRTLAQRSAAAAKEIKQLIGDSVENTTAGTRLVGQAGETMAEIVSSVKRVTEIMSAIASASLQQGSGIGQVNEAVTQMDQVTQQNAALVEEIAASAEVLEERAQSLVELVGAFRLMHDPARPSAGPQAPLNAPAPAPRAPARVNPARAAATPGRRSPTAVVPRPAAAPAPDNADWNSF
jgi:methyl-accepting chemotaxis protein